MILRVSVFRAIRRCFRPHSPGVASLFFTDGLIERRGQTRDEGMAALLAAASAGPSGDPESLCEAVLAALHGHGGDDTVLLAMSVR